MFEFTVQIYRICTDHSASLNKTAGQFIFWLQVQWVTHSPENLPSIKKGAEHTTGIGTGREHFQILKGFLKTLENVFILNCNKNFKYRAFSNINKSSYFPMDKIILIILHILFWLMQFSVLIVSQITFQNYMVLKQNRSLSLKDANIPYLPKY